VRLDQLLAEHAVLAAFTTEAGLTGSPDFQQGAAALTANGTALGAAVGSVYGSAAATAFDKGWAQHIGYFVDYTTATAKHDSAGRAKARAELQGYAASFGKFLATATGLPAGAVQGALAAHVQEHMLIIDDFAAHRYPQAYALERQSYQHMVMVGDTLAGAIAKQKGLAGDATSTAVTTRVKLDTLLGEHTALAFYATQKGLTGAPDFPDAAAALTANTNDLSQLIGSAYGPAAAGTFQGQWAGHIGDLVLYTTATAKHDAAGQAKAVAALNTYVTTFGSFLAKTTGLPASAVQAALKMHVMQHKAEIDEYSAHNYAGAYAQSQQAYAHMYAVGDILAAAIAKHA
jgi:hypothetical protein